MNYRVIFRTLGRVSLVISVLLLLPMLVSVCYWEKCWWSFAATIGVCVVVGLPLVLFCKPKDEVFFSREGLIIVGLSWIFVSLVGALPFVFSGEIPNYIDAFFETVSGFSTTGASILTGDQIENLSKGLQFWRSFTHWIGGMGVIVFVLAVVNGASDRSMHILRAEMPGPTVDKIVPRARSTAKILYLLYICFTLVEIISLIFAGMPIFDSIVHSFGTAGTGGFGIHADSIGGYNNACQWIIAVFMILFSVNFNLYYLVVLRKFRTAFSSRELWIFFGVILVSSAVVCFNVFSLFDYTQNIGDAIRHSVFQVASIISTTGYTTIPSVNDWPLLSRGVFIILMFIGACAGSTGGGLKVSRVAMLGCAIRRALRRVLHPRNVNAVKFEGKVLSDEALSGVTSYFGLYILLFVSTFIVLCFDPCTELTFEANFSAAASCINNIGPAYGVVSNGYYMYSGFSKIVLSIIMLVGRLEIYPILLVFSPSTWSKR